MRGGIPTWSGEVGVYPQISAEFTAVTPSMQPGAEAGPITVDHNLGVIPSVVTGHLEDGAWSHHVGWRLAGRSTTQVIFQFRNNGPNAASAVLRFRLIF